MVRESRMKLTSWLKEQLNGGNISGLEWLKKNETWRLPWMHQSRRDWSEDANAVCTEWEKYRGRTGKSAKAAKATFRNAMRSLIKKKEVKKIREVALSKAPFIIYAFKDPISIKSTAVPEVAEEITVDLVATNERIDSSSEASYEDSSESDDDDFGVPTTVFEAAKRTAVPAHFYKGRKTHPFFKANRLLTQPDNPTMKRPKRTSQNRHSELRKLASRRRDLSLSDGSSSDSSRRSPASGLGDSRDDFPTMYEYDEIPFEIELEITNGPCRAELRQDPETFMAIANIPVVGDYYRELSYDEL